MPAIRMVRIVPQVITVKGVEMEVNCKQLKCFPVFENGQLERFGVLKRHPWQVCIQRANWQEDKIVKILYYDNNGPFSMVFP